MEVFTDYLNEDNLFSIFLCTWVVLGLISAAFFRFNKNPLLKKIVLVISVILTSALFLFFGWIIGFHGTRFIVMLAVTLFISVLNITRTSFCSRCGKTIHNQSPFVKDKRCSTCEKLSNETLTS